MKKSDPNLAKVYSEQDVCIDLPGQAVSCWRTGDKIKVVLRKHRDVIFDIKLGNKKVYSVEATRSDFYNARDKKLVYAKRRDIVNFKDGEKLHLWVTRNFQGELILKCDGAVITRIEPNKLDQVTYNNDPKTKPAPIVIALGEPKTLSSQSTSVPRIAPITGTTFDQGKVKITSTMVPQPAAAPIDEDCPLVCVVDVDARNMPDKLRRHYKFGGGTSGLADIDPHDVATRNWIWGQAVGSGAFIVDNWSWLRESVDSRTSKGFKLVSAKIYQVRGKMRIYFSGYSKYNSVFGQGGFGPSHDRVMSIFGGAGKASSVLKAAGKAIVGAFKRNAFVSFIFGSATSLAEWYGDAKKDGYDLFASILMAALKAVVVAVIVSAIVALIALAAMAALGLSIPVIIIGVMAIALSVGVNYVVEALDKSLGKAVMGDKTNTDGLSASIAPYLRKVGELVQESWDYLVNKFPKDYEGWMF